MQVSHPQSIINGIPPENYFLVRDDLGTPLGEGHTVYQYQPHLYPDAPVRIYFEMNAQPAARFMLLGALIARARQQRDTNPEAAGRAYTCIPLEDEEMMGFYRHSGLDCGYTDALIRFPLPTVQQNLPMNFQVDQSPLNTPMEQNAFLLRLQNNNITHIDPMYLGQLMQMQHFHLLGLFMGGSVLVGEALMSGYGPNCELAAIYINEDQRRRGLGRVLLEQALMVAAAGGVTNFTARIITRSWPQVGLAKKLQAQQLSAEYCFPELTL
ncbi:MAG: GNAT family N-acetyltransferase [Clostridia bacterium]|nr:GNAT family N-acetyltransferase [Clostridia bacterium]